MNPDTAVSPVIHYHIRWVSSGAVDWERHDTRTQAEESATRLSRTNEEYKIEQFDESCVQCRTSNRSVGR